MNLELDFYWRLLVKRLPAMLALFLVCAISAGVYALKLPPTYSTSAQLLVEEAQIPDSLVRNLDQIDAGQQLQVIEQSLLTRANLLDIARKFQVFENMRSMTPNEIASSMRAQTRIKRSSGRSKATLMNVSFRARSGQIAADVVNEYVTLILEESTEFRMSRAENTLTFFQQEVQRLGEDLNQQSALIVSFKNQNSSALPSDLSFRQNRQTLLQERLGRLEREISTLEKQRLNLVRTFEATGQTTTTENLSPKEQQLEQMRLDLQQALSIYSETNPRVVLLKNRIAQTEKSLQEQLVPPAVSEDEEERPVTVLEISLADLDERMKGLQEEMEITSNELDTLETSIQATAGNAIALNALERDFQNTQARYNEAVANLNKARVNERIEVSAQGQRIRVLENANVPRDPSGPNRFKLIATGSFIGAGLAAGLFVLLEFFNRAIRRPFELYDKFGITPLAVIPYMESRYERMRRRGTLVAALLAVLIGVPAALWYIDTEFMPLDILASRILDRLGIT